MASECPDPTITEQPSPASACAGSGTPTFTVTAFVNSGTPLYQCEVKPTGSGATFTPLANNGVYSGVNTASLTVTNPPSSMNGYAFRVVISRDCGSFVTSQAAVLTVNALPAVTLGANPAVNYGITSATLAYGDLSGAPDQYRIDYDAAAETAGFTDATLTSLPASPITLGVPGAPTTTGTFQGLLVVKNSTTGCESMGYAFTVTINPLLQGSLTGDTICVGGTGQLTWNAESGTGPFTVVYNPGNKARTGIYSGVPFGADPNPAVNTIYTLVSVTDANSATRTSGFTGGTATITVNTPPAFTVQPNGISCFDAGDGALTLTVSGGMQPYSYRISADGGSSWIGGGSGWTAFTDPDGTGQVIASLGPADYTIEVMDKKGCVQINGTVIP